MSAKLVRTPSLKRGREDIPVANRVKLERVLGLTVASNSALCSDPNSENILYTAGCTVVSFSPRKNKQTHILNTSRKAVTCIAVTSDGHHLATGECGHMPSVRVWDIPSGTQLTELSGHQYGINCVAFSPNGKHLVSIGSQHDMIVNVWDWKTNLKVASNKVSTKVKAVSFAEDGKYFVTVGMRHVKFWYLEYSRSGKFLDAVPLMGRAGIMGELRDKDFCDVACGRGMMTKSTFTITKSGQLCEVNSRRMLDKWVELRTLSANCMSLGWNYIFVGCADGIVRCFNPVTLQFVTTLPRTHYLGFDISQGFSISHMVQHPSNAKYPDTIAVTFDDCNMKLTCIYNDHSIYIWDVHDIKRVGKTYSFLYHSGCIWGVDIYPLLDSSLPSAMPSGSFITCSSDDTIRVWSLESTLPAHSNYQKNIYSDELLKIVYVDSSLSFIKNQDLSDNVEKNDAMTYDSRNGVRSLCVSPDGQHLASGDRMGNIRIHNLNNMQELCLIEAHDAEVLTLQYSRPECGHRLLASASRDRLLHMFNVDKDYSFAEAFDGHSSSITAVKFITAKDPLQVVSCGADKSIIFRHLVPMPDDTIHFARDHIVACKTTLYDMELDSSQKNILTACQDRNVRVYNVNTGRQKKTFRGSVSEDGSLIKLALDNSGIYLATSCTDKTLCVCDYYSGECMATMLGHSELVTGLKFTNDCSRLISASGDGCIFVWQIPHDMVVTMQARLSQKAARLNRKLLQKSDENLVQNITGVPLSPQDMLDILSGTSPSLLPTWASRHDSNSLSVANTKQLHNLPGGRWAQRLAAMQEQRYDTSSIMLKTFDLQENRLDSDGSKDSSLDSGTELRIYPEKEDSKQGQEAVAHREQKDSDGSEFPRARHLTDDSSLGSYRFEDLESTEHDGDVEDISEAECDSTEQECGPLPLRVYYPPPIETGNEFTVNAMDVEELKRSMRSHKKPVFPEVPVISVPTSVSGSQDSEDDDEDVSTPSGETTERSIHSTSASMENIDFLVQREKFLKNTFESLGGSDVDTKQLIKPSGGNSITSKFLGQASLGHQENKIQQLPSWKDFTPTRAPPSSPRNNIICPKRFSGSHLGMDDKRSLLKRRLEDMRQQLESVGYTRRGVQSSTSARPLRNSISVADLTELDNRRESRSKAHQDATYTAESDEELGGMRRTFSLSDLRPSLWDESGNVHQLGAKCNKRLAAPASDDSTCSFTSVIVLKNGRACQTNKCARIQRNTYHAHKRVEPRINQMTLTKCTADIKQQNDIPFCKPQMRDDPKRQVYLSRSTQENVNVPSSKRPVPQILGISSRSGNMCRELHHSSSMNRSMSMGELNQNDSYGDALQNRLNSLMRPTISSRNKVVSVSKSAVGPPPFRHGLTGSRSSVNLSGIDNEESSSEEVLGTGRSQLHVHNLDRSASANNVNTAAFRRSDSGFKKNSTNVMSSPCRPSSRLTSSGARPKQLAKPRNALEHEKLNYNLTICVDLAKKLKDLAQQVTNVFSQIQNQVGAVDYSQEVDVLLEALHTSMLTMMAGEFVGLEIASSPERDANRWSQFLREQLAIVVSAYLNRNAVKKGTDEEWQGHLESVIEDMSSKLLEVLVEESKTLC